MPLGVKLWAKFVLKEELTMSYWHCRMQMCTEVLDLIDNLGCVCFGWPMCHPAAVKLEVLDLIDTLGCVLRLWPVCRPAAVKLQPGPTLLPLWRGRSLQIVVCTFRVMGVPRSCINRGPRKGQTRALLCMIFLLLNEI